MTTGQLLSFIIGSALIILFTWFVSLREKRRYIMSSHRSFCIIGTQTMGRISKTISIAVFLTCKVEEREMISRFGEEYRDYMKKTKLWFPFVL